ncbi:MAG: HAD family hydrolase [Clostridia bacterium]|nr:HAD family hydrolase [Clostridia bacterium]
MKQRFIFDLDGTLLHGDFTKEINYFKETLGENADKFLKMYSEILMEYEATHTKYDEKMLSDYYKQKTGMNITSEIIDGWVKINADINDVLLKETIDMLKYLKSKNKSLVVLTNWFRYTQVTRLKNAGILEYFDEVYTGDVIMKPYKNSYINACGKYPISECVMIGDTIDKDVLGPNKIGLDSIYYNPEGKDYDEKNIVSINSFGQIMEMY